MLSVLNLPQTCLKTETSLDACMDDTVDTIDGWLCRAAFTLLPSAHVGSVCLRVGCVWCYSQYYNIQTRAHTPT